MGLLQKAENILPAERSMNQKRNLFFLLFLSAMLFSCSLNSSLSDTAESVAIPESYVGESGESVLPEKWWEAFEDERLNSLVEELLSANLDLEQAWARIDQAEALAVQTGSALLPGIALEGATSRARTYTPSSSSADSMVPVHTRQHTLGLAASYEIDLWGRTRSSKKASMLDVEAVRLDLETAAMSLTAQVAQDWYSLIEHKAQLELVQNQVKASSKQLDLVKLRFSRGLASALDVYQQRQQLASLTSQRPLIEAQISIVTHQLNVLLGKDPNTPVENIPDTLPELWPRPAAGLPADLLTHRPDVKASMIRIKAAEKRIASAVSERFPRISISASRGYGAESFAEMFDRMIWNVVGGAAVSLYEGGARSAEVRRTEAVGKERLYAYAKTVLEAFAEVEGALKREQKQIEYVGRLREQLELSQSTLERAYTQYVNGLSDYLAVLSALNSLQQTQRELLAARSDLISYRIALCRSLGGTWTTEIERKNNAGDKS